MSWLTSPLTATAVVCAGLAALSVPLRRLTSAPVSQIPAKIETTGDHSHHGHDHVHEMPGVLRVKLLASVRSLLVVTTDGDELWAASNLEAGEHEADVDFLLIDDALELRVEADFSDTENETALFLTVLPDGVEEQTRYAVGSGVVDEIFHYAWDLH